MAETALYPRPTVYTFLQGEYFRGGDPLTYYDYHRAIRSKQVEILQQHRRSSSHEPEYKKPGVPHPASRKVLLLKNRAPDIEVTTPTVPASKTENVASSKEAAVETTANTEQINRSACGEGVNRSDSTTSLDAQETSEKSKTSPSGARPSSAGMSRKENTTEPTTSPDQAQTECLVQTAKKPRLVKSATFSRDHQPSSFSSAISSAPPLPPRPKTVTSFRESGVQAMQEPEGTGKLIYTCMYCTN